MAEPVHAYLEARVAEENARRKVESLVKIIWEGANILRDWRTTMISNSIGFPMEIAMSRKASIDAQTWPTMDQVAHALVAWHHAQHSLLQAWDSVPEGFRKGLQPPDIR